LVHHGIGAGPAVGAEVLEAREDPVGEVLGSRPAGTALAARLFPSYPTGRPVKSPP
jgi:hypothetical protein